MPRKAKKGQEGRNGSFHLSIFPLLILARYRNTQPGYAWGRMQASEGGIRGRRKRIGEIGESVPHCRHVSHASCCYRLTALRRGRGAWAWALAWLGFGGAAQSSPLKLQPFRDGGSVEVYQSGVWSVSLSVSDLILDMILHTIRVAREPNSSSRVRTRSRLGRFKLRNILHARQHRYCNYLSLPCTN